MKKLFVFLYLVLLPFAMNANTGIKEVDGILCQVDSESQNADVLPTSEEPITVKTQTARKWSIIPQVGFQIMECRALQTTLGVRIGATAEWQTFKKLGFSAGLMFTRQTYKPDKDEIGAIGLFNSPIKASILEIPIMASVGLWHGFSLKAGMQVNVQLHIDKESWTERQESYNLIIESHYESTRKILNDCYLTLPVGISYEWRRFIVDLRYVFGLKNLNVEFHNTISQNYGMNIEHNESTYFENSKVNNLQLTIGYRL